LNCMMLRGYLILRLFATYSKWTNEVASGCCEPERCEANTVFALKSVFKEKPYILLLSSLFTSIIILGLIIRTFERPYYYGWPTNQPGFQDYSYIWNGMWLTAITMMTVGYGDYYPKTHMGRFVAVIACFLGVFIASLIIATLTVSTSFNVKEKKAHTILLRMNVKVEIKAKAKKLIYLMVKLTGSFQNYKRGKITFNEYVEKKCELRSMMQIRIEQFKAKKLQLKEYELPP